MNTWVVAPVACEDLAIVQPDTLYRCLDKLLEHKAALFSHLKDRWQTLFGASFEVLLYDLTSTYFECDVPQAEGLRRFGYSRDKRSDCVQVVIALIVTPQGFPLAYEVMAGNTADCTTLEGFVEKIHHRNPIPVERPVMATATFAVGGAEQTLQGTRYGDTYMFHFTDATSGHASYGSGRAVHTPLDRCGAVSIDFNYARLLACSFSRAWNCPIPTLESRLRVPIEAGARFAVDKNGVPML